MSYRPRPGDRDDAAGRRPPGWYLDPRSYLDPAGHQVLRWWDGTQWGQQTQPLPGRGQEPPIVYPQQPYGQDPRQSSFTPDPQYGTPPGQPPYQGHPQYPGTSYGQHPSPQAQSYGQQPGPPSGYYGRPPRNSWPRRHKALTVLGGLVALIIIGSIASAAGGGNHASPSAPAVAGSSPTAAAASTSTSATPAAASRASFSAKFDQAPLLMGPPDSHGVATYTVEFDVTNTSKVPGTPVCVLLNSVQSTAVPNGNVIRTIDREAAGQTRTVFSGVAITGRGAADATNWSIHCQQGTELPLDK